MAAGSQRKYVKYALGVDVKYQIKIQQIKRDYQWECRSNITTTTANTPLQGYP